MQIQAWYIIAPDGKRYGPSYTEKQAQIAASAIATKSKVLDECVALTLFRSMATVGWRIVKSPMKNSHHTNDGEGDTNQIFEAQMLMQMPSSKQPMDPIRTGFDGPDLMSPRSELDAEIRALAAQKNPHPVDKAQLEHLRQIRKTATEKGGFQPAPKK